MAGDDTSGEGEATDVEPTEPGSLKPCVPSSGGSKKLKLNSEPAAKLTSAFNFSGGGALPKFVLSDWSSLNTSIFLPFIANNFSWHIREKTERKPDKTRIATKNTRLPKGGRTHGRLSEALQREHFGHRVLHFGRKISKILGKKKASTRAHHSHYESGLPWAAASIRAPCSGYGRFRGRPLAKQALAVGTEGT